MKRKRKVWYSIVNPDHWWCGKKIGWVKNGSLDSTEHNGASTWRDVKTGKKAFAIADAMPSGSKVIQFSIQKGKRVIKTWTKI